METKLEVLEPTIKPEGKLMIDWPSPEDFAKEKDEYLVTNLERYKDEVRMHYPEDPEEVVEKVARMLAETGFVFKLMMRVAPLPITVPVELKTDYNPETEFRQGVNPIVDNNLSLVGFEYSVSADAMKDCAKPPYEGEDLSEEELDAIAMGGAVQEFAHMLYIIEAEKMSPKKIHGKFLAMMYHANAHHMNSMERNDEYYGLEIEVRARLWQKVFLTKYFPNSDELRFMEKELAFSQRMLDKKRAEEKRESEERELD